LWDARTGRELRRIQAQQAGFRCMAFSPDGLLLATGDYFSPEPSVKVWEVAALRRDEKVVPPGRTHLIAQVIAAQGFASPGVASPIVPQAIVSLGVAAFDVSALVVPLHTLKGHTGQFIGSIAFSPDGERLASGGGRGKEF